MSRVKGKNTKPELHVRSLLHKAGFRFRLSSDKAPGSPDIILLKYKAIILVHGCFWHGHDCSRFSWPQSNEDFWKKKIEGNQKRDARYLKELNEAGWRVCVVWECALRGKGRVEDENIGKRFTTWLLSERKLFSIRGRKS